MKRFFAGLVVLSLLGGAFAQNEAKKTIHLEMPVKPVHQMKIKFTVKAAAGSTRSHEIYHTIHRVASQTGSAK